MTATLGDGAFRFRALEDWANLPAEIELGDVAGVAIDQQDRVFLFNCGLHPIVILSQAGAFLNSWDHGLFANAHGAHIGAAGAIYLTDNVDPRCAVQPRWEAFAPTWRSEEAGRFHELSALCRCTHTALSPKGEISVSGGYGNATKSRRTAGI